MKYKNKNIRKTTILILVAIFLSFLSHLKLEFIYTFIQVFLSLSLYAIYLIIRFNFWKCIIIRQKAMIEQNYNEIKNKNLKNDRLYFLVNIFFLTLIFPSNIIYFDPYVLFNSISILISILWFICLEVNKKNFVIMKHRIDNIKIEITKFYAFNFILFLIFFKKLTIKIAQIIKLLTKYFIFKHFVKESYFIYKFKISKLNKVKLISYEDSF
ncbi:hypothetical protein SLITO_v1c01590 [Spiroplasma litorale]|uniref:Uncharacterized protein n=1 Tax=Spiroplasma litorale TaxID=216942 RepID=A0A0K1W0J3_9MOLU|nr:hypothetical protein [Spiroplasma litorale]AKX33825.1 hypothetical protein SLITO_v1c01590 [Spiroplasma litorale]